MERAAQIVLPEVVDERPVERAAELEVVIAHHVGDEPRRGVVPLPLRVDAAAGPRRIIVPEAVHTIGGRQVPHLPVAGHVPVQVVPGGRGPGGILVAAGDPHGVDDVVPDDAGVAPDPDHLVVLLVVPRCQRPASEPFGLRAELAHEPQGPRVVPVDLLVHPVHGVPRTPFLRPGIVQIRTAVEPLRPGRVGEPPLEAREEVRVVLHDRPAEYAAELVLVVRRLDCARVLLEQLVVEVVARRHRGVGAVAEAGAGPLVRPPLGHRVDDGAAGAAELGVELPADDLELLHRLDRHLDLAAA